MQSLVGSVRPAPSLWVVFHCLFRLVDAVEPVQSPARPSPRGLLSAALIDALDLLLWMLIYPFCCAPDPIVAIDVPFQTWNHNRQLKMTAKQGIKGRVQGQRQTGKPEVKGKIRQLQMQTAMRRMMGMCPRRTSLITNPNSHHQWPLKYDARRFRRRPAALAKVDDEVAMKIRR